MQDPLHPVPTDGRTQVPDAEHVPPFQDQAAPEALDEGTGALRGGDDVEQHHLLAPVEQASGDLDPDEPRAAGDQGGHVASWWVRTGPWPTGAGGLDRRIGGIGRREIIWGPSPHPGGEARRAARRNLPTSVRGRLSAKSMMRGMA